MDAGPLLKYIVGGVFCLLFCYLFLDRFLFGRRLDALLFGRPLRRLAELLDRWARKTGVHTGTPPAKEPFRRDATSVPEDDLVPRGGAHTRHTAPIRANAGQGGESATKLDTFVSATDEKASEQLPEMFIDPTRIDFYNDYLRDALTGTVSSADKAADKAPSPADGTQEHASFLANAAPASLQDCGQGIGSRELE